MRIGFIGLGNMGEPMATSLARAGEPLTVFDLRPEPLARLKELGADVANSPREVAENADLIEIVLVDDAQVHEVTTGPDGVLAGASPGALILIHSTVDPGTCRRLAELANRQGVALLDAPVSGGAFRAREGTLSMMVGGDEGCYERVRPVLEKTTSALFYMGPLGTGLAAKLANNLVALVNGRVLEEGLALAKKSGISEQRMLEVLNVSTGESFTSRMRTEVRAEERSHPGGDRGMHRIREKDVALAVMLARELGVRTPMGECLAELHETRRSLEV